VNLPKPTPQAGLAGLTAGFLLLSLMLLAACAPRGQFALVPDLPTTTHIQPIYTVTGRDSAGPLQASGARGDKISRALINVSIPPDHETGQVEYPTGQADPNRHFTVASAVGFTNDTGLIRHLARAGDAKSDIVVYVHGYNNNHAEAVFRHAQIAADYDLRGPQISYTWPSAARPAGYIYDRDSVGFSRDGLENLLVQLSRQQNRKVLLVGHSMGAHLIVETLRQMSIGGKSRAMSRLSGVVLLSPDIDIDLFESQISRINPLPDPFVLMVSQNDRTLRFSALLTGQQMRLGSISDMARLRRLGVGLTVIDLTAFSNNAGTNHMLAATSPAAIAVLNGMTQSLPRTDNPRMSLPFLAVVLPLPKPK